MFYSRLSWFLTGVGCFLRSRYTYVPHSASTTLQTSVKFWKILRYVLSIDYEMLCVALLEYCRFLLGTSKSRAAPPTVFSVVLVVSFPVFFVLLVLRVWVNSSYCQSRETLFRTLNKGCYKKSWGVDDQSSFLPTTFSLQLPCLSFSWLLVMKLMETENSHILN